MSLKSILSGLLTIAGAVSGVNLKKKPCCLWYWNGKEWKQQGGTMSARQCRKTLDALVKRHGLDPAMFSILRKGVTPPPQPPVQKEGKGK